MALFDDVLPGRSEGLTRTADAVSAIQPPIDRSSGMAKTLGDKAAEAIPAAFKAEETQAAERREVMKGGVKDLERVQANRAEFKAPLPPAPERQPQPGNTDPLNAWGSLAMAFATIASGFTRRPMINALNGAASVMNAYKAKDEAAYKHAFEAWKADTEYVGKLYEYQRDAYRDALEGLDRDEKTALAKVKVAAWALNDEPMKRAIELQGAAGAVELTRQRDLADQKTRLEVTALTQIGEVSGEVMSAQKALQANPNDPAAQQRLKTAAETYRLLKDGRAGAGTAGQLHESKEWEIRDKEGKVVERLTAREGHEAGMPVRTDTGKPIELQPGQSIHRAPPGSEGRQEAGRVGRLVGATTELAPALKNLTELPIDSSLGAFMGLQSERPAALREAVARVAATHLVGEQAIAVSQQFAGLQRQLATIEAQGAAQGLVGLTNANNVLVPQSGWSGTAVMRSYAEIRQIAQANIRAMLASPYVSGTQRQLLNDLSSEIETAVPYTVHDVNELAFGNKKKFRESVSSFADKVLQRRQPSSDQAGPPPEAVRMLREDPSDTKKQYFDKTFGTGAAEKALAQ